MKNLYKEQFVERDFERLELFRLLESRFDIHSVLYPGSFIHITPSFIFPIVVYVDNDRNAVRYFKSGDQEAIIKTRKEYPQEAVYRFHAQDYMLEFHEAKSDFDLLISQYAGFVSQACKGYLKIGGLLLANNSHGDASMAVIDRDFQIEAVIKGSPHKPTLITEYLETYLEPKKPEDLTHEHLMNTRRGVAFHKKARHDLFRKVK
jgi:hypothetical protein